MGLTVAPFGAWFLAWVALAPLWVLVVNSAQRNNPSPPSSLSSSLPLSLPLAWGIGYHGIALSWITGIHPMTWMGVPWLASLAIALFCWTFITLWGAALVATWATCFSLILDFRLPILDWFKVTFKRENKAPIDRSKIQNPKSKIQNGFVRVLIGTAIWCGLEALWSAGPLWWSSLSYTQSPQNLVILHLGQLSGPNAVTAAIVAVNGLLAEAWINRRSAENTEERMKFLLSATSAPRRFNYLVSAAALFISLHLIGLGLYSRPLVQKPEAALKVGIVQGNVPNEIKLFREGFRRAIEGYTKGYITLVDRGVDAVLTPEGALPFFQNDIMSSSLVAAVREKKKVAWIGGFYRDGRSYTNSLFTVTDSGVIFSRYGKVKMVPIGEYVPFEEILGGIIDRLSPLKEHQVAGKQNQIFDTPFGRAIVGICYESAFSEHFRRQAVAGGEFILGPSNDAHYSAAMPAQHHAQDIMRAIETDRWAVRATNTGYSAFVDPHGRTLWISGHNTYEVRAETIYRLQSKTLYVLWGDWLTPLLLGVSGLGWFVGYRFW
ncbi:apolipoprotein N-acyltransferase [Scytonema hofmannii]|nr:apolipoprotein N-acyltransferase [Scytonema hofmannii]